MISIKNIEKKFGKLIALDNISIFLNSGKSYALIGPNGSGKTTLIKCLLGLVVPSKGEISIDSQSINKEWKYRDKIGYMPQIGRYPDNMKIGQLFDMMKNIRADVNKTDDELIEAFQLYKLFDKRMHSLSGGTRQKVSACLAFLFHPPILILDEPTAGLDPLAAEILKEKTLHEKRMGKLLIITSHILSDLEELTNEMIYLKDGIVQYNNSIDALKDETKETKLNKAVATLIKQKELLTSVTNTK